MTSIECTDDECNCGSRCANQRFQLREYAGVDVFHAGKKGFGLRALVDLHKDMFVYEYVGEVIGEKRFRQRQIEYQEQGEKHFYFMMLQKGEYIDATKKGGFGRFINHSCEPNCYVDKWVVGSKLRMGIFTKRAIVTGEELTFDYNVDRYGGEATPCYCGEPTCIGYIGGKTQTEAANRLPQNVVEALGIDDDDDWDEAKPKNRRRKKGQDDEEYVNDLTPRGILEKDVPKIMATLLQSTERWLLKKLLQRISNDGDEKIQTKIVALHGYQTLGAKLEKWRQDSEISILILEILQKWPSMTKNKISSSKIETHVKALADAENTTPEVKQLSTTLLNTWSNLEMAYRIPRRVRPIKSQSNDEPELSKKSAEGDPPMKVSSSGSAPQDVPIRRGPRNPTYRKDQPWRRQEYNYKSRDFTRQFSGSASHTRLGTGSNSAASLPSTPVKIEPINQDLQAIIDAATKKQQEQAAALKVQEEKKAAEEAERLKAEALKRADRIRRYEEHKLEKEKRALAKRDSNGHSTARSTPPSSDHTKKVSGKIINHEKVLTNLFAKYVTNTIAKYQDRLGKEQFKRRAKEIVQILVSKEMRKGNREVTELSDSKRAKIKAFSRDFMERVLARKNNKSSKQVKAQEACLDKEDAASDDEDLTRGPLPNELQQGSGAASERESFPEGDLAGGQDESMSELESIVSPAEESSHHQKEVLEPHSDRKRFMEIDRADRFPNKHQKL